MFNFLKKDKEESEDKIEITQEAKESAEESLKELYDSKVNDSIVRELEYTNVYLAQLLKSQSELVKQQTIANALNILNHQYEHPDSFMSVDEIQEKYLALAHEIFVDYRTDDLNNLEEKK